MKKIFLIFVLLLGISLYAEQLAKSTYIKQANQGDIKAMVAFSKHYPYDIQTKEGRNYYERWYKTVLKSEKEKEILTLLKLYEENEKIFINGKQKVFYLYEHLFELGSFEGFKNYMDSNVKSKYKVDQVYKKFQTKLNVQEHIELLELAEKIYYDNLIKKLLLQLEKSDFNLYTSDAYLSYLYRTKKEDFTVIEKRINENNKLDELLALSQLYRKYSLKEKEKNVLNKAIEINPSNKTTLLYLSNLYAGSKYRSVYKEDIPFFIEYTKRAYEQDKENFTLIKRLFKLHNYDRKYYKEHLKAKKILQQTPEGNLFLIKEYDNFMNKDYMIRVGLAEALNGNINAISKIYNRLKGGASRNLEYELMFNKLKEILEGLSLFQQIKIYELLFDKNWHDNDFVKKYETLVFKTKYIPGLRKLISHYQYKDNKKYKYYIEKSVEWGDIDKVIYMARFPKYKGDMQKAIDKYIKLNSAEMMAIKANNLKYSDFKQCIPLYEKAAKLGYIPAINELVPIYRNSEKDYKKAFEWMQKGLFFGNEEHYFRMGYEYHAAKVLKQDYKKAHYFYSISSNNEKYANNNLGLLYENGQGVKKDLHKAFEYYKKSAEYGGSEGAENLARFYENGLVSKVDLEKALEYYKKSETKYSKDAIKRIESMKGKK